MQTITCDTCHNEISDDQERVLIHRQETSFKEQDEGDESAPIWESKLDTFHYHLDCEPKRD